MEPVEAWALSRRFGYFCLYSWAHGMEFGLRGKLKSPKNNIDNGYDDLFDHECALVLFDPPTTDFF